MKFATLLTPSSVRNLFLARPYYCYHHELALPFVIHPVASQQFLYDISGRYQTNYSIKWQVLYISEIWYVPPMIMEFELKISSIYLYEICVWRKCSSGLSMLETCCFHRQNISLETRKTSSLFKYCSIIWLQCFADHLFYSTKILKSIYSTHHM